MYWTDLICLANYSQPLKSIKQCPCNLSICGNVVQKLCKYYPIIKKQQKLESPVSLFEYYTKVSLLLLCQIDLWSKKTVAHTKQVEVHKNTFIICKYSLNCLLRLELSLPYYCRLVFFFALKAIFICPL